MLAAVLAGSSTKQSLLSEHKWLWYEQETRCIQLCAMCTSGHGDVQVGHAEAAQFRLLCLSVGCCLKGQQLEAQPADGACKYQ